MEKLKARFTKWSVWKFGEPRANGDKPSMIPVNLNTGGAGASNDPDTFGTYDEARAAFERGAAGAGYRGLAVLMSSGPGAVCVDVDSCIGEDGAPDVVGIWALKNFAGYVEVSQSGHGLHFFMLAAKPEGCATKATLASTGWRGKPHSVEIYDSKPGRFIAVTGDEYGGGDRPVLDEQAALDRFIARYGFMKLHPDNDKAADKYEHGDEEILGLLRKRNKRGKVTRLLAGSLDDYNGDHSSADMGLLAEIAYYTRDPEQVRRVFEHSVLAERGKWRERADYRDRSIERALGGARNYYWDDKAKAGAAASTATVRVPVPHLVGGIEGLRITRGGAIAPTLSNAIQVLIRDHRVAGCVAFNEFSGSVEVRRPLRELLGASASATLGEWRDADTTPLRRWLSQEYRIELPKSEAEDAIADWARHYPFNPVTDALKACGDEWDGTQRMDTWLQTYLGAHDAGPEYLREVGRCWLIGAVARAFRPGCKVDAALILEGKQGVGKSRAARALCEAVHAQGFVDNLPVLGDRHAAGLSLRGAWIIELAELAAVRRASAEQLKAFISTQADRLRVPWGRRFENWQRTCVFIGSTNTSEFIPDDTGGRRFWPVVVGRIDVEAIERDARQLWGEAVRAFQSGEAWHLTGTVAIGQAAEEQRNRQIGDAWDDAVQECAAVIAASPHAFDPRSLGDAWRAVFPREAVDITMRPMIDQKRFAGALRRAGFESRKVRGVMRWHLQTAAAQALAGDRVGGPGRPTLRAVGKGSTT